MRLKKYYRLTRELIGDLKNHSVLKSDQEMNAFGCKVIGQGYMINSYRQVPQKEFLSTISEEIDFIKKQKNLEKVNVIDAGANLGFYSLAYAKSQDDVNVLSFEPFPTAFQHLKKNVEANKLPNVRAVNFGLFSETKTLKIGRPSSLKFYNFAERIFKFFDGKTTGCMSVYTEGDSGIEAKFIKGDELEKHIALDAVDIFKIDVEGAEYAVLEGSTELIKKNRPLLKIEFNTLACKVSEKSPQDIADLLKELGYTKYTYENAEDRFDNWKDINSFESKENDSSDILFYYD
jgi:FkbM family methyltransferase